MSDEKRGSRIPSIPESRLDHTPAKTTGGYNKEDEFAQALIKGKEPTKALTLRMPVKIWKQLKEIAYFKETTITKLVLNCIKDDLQKRERRKAKQEQTNSK